MLHRGGWRARLQGAGTRSGASPHHPPRDSDACAGPAASMPRGRRLFRSGLSCRGDRWCPRCRGCAGCRPGPAAALLNVLRVPPGTFLGTPGATERGTTADIGTAPGDGTGPAGRMRQL